MLTFPRGVGWPLLSPGRTLRPNGIPQSGTLAPYFAGLTGLSLMVRRHGGLDGRKSGIT
jgi:hypothetical protein